MSRHDQPRAEDYLGGLLAAVILLLGIYGWAVMP